jgi:outer membrane lipoprotein-sorting protein
LFNKFFIILFIIVSFSLNTFADEKKLIVDRLININNITFNFEQITNKKKETGTCTLVFDNKLICDYEDSMQKRILINKKTLVIQHRRYNKFYFYPISKSPFIKIFSKNNLINLIKKSDYQLNNNIEIIHIDKDGRIITIFFKKNNYDLVGWKVVDQLQNEVYFSIKIKNVNSEINNKIFLIPSVN